MGFALASARIKIPCVQTEPVAVDGVAGPVAVTVNEAWKKPQITVSGQPAPFLGGQQYALPAADGSTIRATLRRQIASPYPTLEVRGVRYRTGPKTPVVVLVLMVLSILLMLPVRMVRPTLLGLIGSVPGGIVGVLGLAVNIAVARTEMSAVGKSCLMIGVAVAVAAVSYVIMAVVAAGSVGALPWAADRFSPGRATFPVRPPVWPAAAGRESRKNGRPGRSRRSPSIA